MTVKELIENLQKQQQDATVIVANDDGYWPRVVDVQIDDVDGDILLIVD